MIKTKQVFSNAYGQSAIVEEQLIDNTTLQFNGKTYYYSDAQGVKTVALTLDSSGKLQSSTYNKTSGQWSAPVLLTPSSPYQLQAEKGQPSGFASLDSATKVPIDQIPISKFYNIYQGTLNNMTNANYYTSPPYVGNIYLPTDNWQSFVLANSDYTQLSSWVIINRPQPSTSRFFQAEISSDQSIAQSPQVVQYDNFQQSPTPGITYLSGYFTIQPGTYRIDVQMVVQYQNTTNYPISYYAELQSAGIISKSMRECDTVSNFNQRKTQTSFFVVAFTAPQVLSIMVMSNNPNSVKSICQGSSVYIATIG